MCSGALPPPQARCNVSQHSGLFLRPLLELEGCSTVGRQGKKVAAHLANVCSPRHLPFPGRSWESLWGSPSHQVYHHSNLYQDGATQATIKSGCSTLAHLNSNIMGSLVSCKDNFRKTGWRNWHVKPQPLARNHLLII